MTSGTNSGTHLCFSLVEQTVALLVVIVLPECRDNDGVYSSHVFDNTFWKSGHDDYDITIVSIVASKLSKNVPFSIWSKKTFLMGNLLAVILTLKKI